jgi:hypothetical protein
VDVLVEFWQCLGCKKAYRTPRAMYQRLAPFLPSQSTGNPSVVFACTACNLMRSYDKSDLPLPRTLDIEDLAGAVFAEKIFRAEIACGQENCESRMLILWPTTQYMTADWLKIYSTNWLPENTRFTACGHDVTKPVKLVRSFLIQ